MRKRFSWIHRFAILVVGLVATVQVAHAERNFAARFDTNDYGDILIIGNTLMSCPQGANNPPTACLASVPVSGTGATGGNLDDNNYNMRLVNTAAGTASSSSADLALPTGATVLWAGLYWGADTSAGTNGSAAANASARNQIRFSVPSGTYQTLTATQVDAATTAGQANRYSAFADVTTRIQAAGAGTYRVADIQAGTGGDRYAGWSLVVVVRDTAQPLRNLTVFDGYQVVNSSAATVNIAVSGFRTPLSGAFTVRAGAVAYEGDLGQTGDQLRLNGVNLGNATNPTTNVFNSTISRLGAAITAKNPNFANQMGFDADVFDASGILANGATGATLTFTTGGETYYPAVLTFANDVYQPVVEGNVVKTVSDLNGGSVLPGDILQYTVVVSNSGNDAAVNSVLTDAIPANTTYVAGSLTIASGANAGAKTDASGDDQANFNGSAVVFRLGTGATASAGGSLGINQSTSITFRVRVNAGVAAGTTIANQATVAYNGASLGTPFTSQSDGDPNTAGTQPTTVVVGSAQARLAITKVGTPNPVVAGQNLTYTLHVDNNGPNNATGVLVSDPLPATLTFVSATASPAWTISAPAVGATGTVQFSASDLPVGGYDLVIVARVVPGTPGGTVIGNTASLTSSNDPTGGHDAATNTTVANSGDLSLAKAADAVVGQGQQLGYTLQLNNPGPDPATGVVVSDPLPANTTFVSATAPPGWIATTPAVGASGTVTFNIASLPTGVYSFAITVQVTAGATLGGTITNTATVTSTSADANPANNTASAGTLIQNPVPSVAKTFTPATVGSGIPSTLRITITNDAAIAISGIAISDTLPTSPGQMRVTNPATGANNTCGGTFTAAGNATAISLANGALAAGASCFVEVNVVATTVGNYVNTTGNITSTQTPAGPTATATLGVGLLNAPTTTKSFNPASVPLGSAAQMTIAFANPNAAPITGVAFTDNYPAGIVNGATVVASNSCGGTVTGVAGGNSLQLAGATIPVAGCAVVVNVVATAIGNAVNTTGAITTTNSQPGTGATGTLAVTPLTAPTTTKAFAPATVLLGGASQMTITLTNPNATAIAQAGLSDNYPAGIANAPSGVLVSNSCGGTVTADPSDTSLALSGGTIPANGNCSIVVNVVATAEGAQVNNTGTISSSNAQTGAGASGTLMVNPSADVSVAKSGPASVGYGGAIAYTIVVSNAGPSAANGTTFSDPVPAGITGIVANCGGETGGAVCGAVNIAGNNVTSTITTLPASGSVTFTISGIAPTSGAGLSNTANVSPPTGTTDPNNANNASTAVTTLLPPQLSVTKAATPNPFIVGQPAQYTITVQNTGAGVTAAAITIADTLPTGITLASASGANWGCTGTTTLSCTFAGTLAPGASTTLTLNVNVGANATIANNSASASGGGDPGCPTAARCIGTVAVPVAASADIAVAKMVDNPAPNVGETITFTVTATNNGPSNATGVEITDALPSGLAFVSAAPSQGVYDSGTGRWTIGALANGASETLDIVASVLSPGALTNIATRTGGDQLDPDPSNNSASASLNAQPTADIRVAKTVDNPAPNVGTNIVYTITATNAGPNDATGVAVADPLPAGTAFVSAVASQGSYIAANGIWTIGAIANGASATLTLTATVTLPGDITNTATVSGSDQFDPITANNSGGVTVNGQSADVQVVKTVDNANPIVGDTVTFTITATNNGPSSATGLTITDLLPSELAFVSAAPSQGVYDALTGAWTLGALAATGPGANATLTIVATVISDGGFTNSAAISAADQPDPNPSNDVSEVVVTPIASADLALTKTGPATAIAGQQVAYTLTVTNNGPSSAANVTLDDPTPAGLAFVSATAPCAAGFPCNLGTIAAGGSTTITAIFAVPSSASGSIANTASVGSDTFDPNAGNNTSTANTNVIAQADLLVVKSGPASVIAGAPIAYSVVVTNNGPSDANGTTFSDAVPAAITGVTASCGAPTGGAVCGAVNVAGNNVTSTITTLPSGASVTFTINGTAPADGFTSLTNTASAAPPTGVTDPDPSDNTSTATTSVIASADVSIVKTGPPNATPGISVTFALAISNNGPSTAQAVQIADPTPPGLVFVTASSPCAGGFPCNLGNLPPGFSTVVTATFAVPSDYAGASIVNTATLSSTTGDPNSGNNSSTVTIPVAGAADLAVVKSGPATVTAGQTIAYSVVVSNAGPSAVAGALFSDPVPAGITGITASCGAPTNGAACGAVNITGNNVTSTIASLPVGGSVTFTIDGIAPAEPITLHNIASIAPPAGVNDPVSANNTSTATTSVSASADVSIVKSGPASVISGGAITYTLLVANAGPSAANGATYTDTLPAGITAISASCGNAVGGATCASPTVSGSTVSGTVPTLPAGGSVTITIDGTAPFGAATLTNNATTVPPSNVSDPNSGNNSSTVSTDIGAAADVAVAKTVDNASPNVGDIVTFTITATNAGPDDATGVAVTDGLPFGLTFVSANVSQGTYSSATGLWSIGAIANGAIATLTIVATVDDPGALTNTATVSASDQTDPDASNNSAGVALNAGASADLAIAKSVDNTAPNVGDTVTFTIALTNNGPNDSTGAEVTDVLPAGLTLISATPSQGSYDDASGVWSVGAIANGSVATLALAVSVDQAGAITNIATITGENENDPAQGNNQAGAAVNGQLADIQVLKTVDNAAPNVGDTVTFTITAHDAGPNDATGVVVVDVLPAGLALVSATASQGTYASATGDWTIGALTAAGATSTATLTIVATVQDAGALTNTASVTTSDQPDPNSTNNSASASLNGNPLADLAVTKSGPATVTPGNDVVYTIVVTNNGPSDAVNVVVDDPTPADLTFVGNAGACESAYPCTIAALASGASATITTTMSVPANYAGANPIVNTANATSDTPDPDNTDNQGSATTNVGPGSADLAIVKSGPAQVTAGGALAYSLTITNNGPSPANGASYNDDVPAGVTISAALCGGEAGGAACVSQPVVAGNNVSGTIGTLPSGGSVVVTITGTAPPTATTLTNTATLAPPAGITDPDSSNDSSTAVTQVVVGATSADLSILKTGPASAMAGSTATYTLAVTNNGPDTAVNARLSDPAPAGFTFVSASAPCAGGFPCALGDLASGATVSITVSFAIDPAASGGVVNTATVGSDTQDPNALDNDSSVSTTIVPATTSADLSVTKTGPANAPAGGTVTYTLTVTNGGPDTAIGATLFDATPAGLTFASASAPCTTGSPCVLGDIASGASVTVTATFVIDPNASGAVVNTATIGSSTPDPNALNNDSSVSTTIVAGATFADLSVTKTGPANVAPGSTVTYSIAVVNNGPDAAVNAMLSDPTPAGLSFLSASAPCSSGFPCALGTLASGAGVTVVATFAVSPSASGTVTNTATVGSDTSDPDAANSSSTATTVIAGVPPVESLPVPVDQRWMLVLLAVLLAGVGLWRRAR